MKTSTVSRNLVILLAGICSQTCSTFAQSWQTVDDFIYAPGGGGKALAVDADQNGGLYVAGFGNASGTWHALVQYSPDSGATWSMLDDFVYPGASTTEYTAVHVDPSGTLFAAGYISYSGVGSRWFVRRSTDEGRTWTTADSYWPSGFTGQVPYGVASDGIGNVYAAGFGTDNHGTGHWIIRASADFGATWRPAADFPVKGRATGATCVGTDLYVVGNAGSTWQVRKSSDQGLTWTIVDNYQYDPNHSAVAKAITADSAGNVYVTGNATYWVTRKLSAGSSTWETLDVWQPPGSLFTTWGLDFSSSGNLYVAGQVYISSAYHWIVRKLDTVTTSWATVDDFSYAMGRDSDALGIVGDPYGNMFTVGFCLPPSTPGHWVVRKASGQRCSQQSFETISKT